MIRFYKMVQNKFRFLCGNNNNKTTITQSIIPQSIAMELFLREQPFVQRPSVSNSTKTKRIMFQLYNKFHVPSVLTDNDLSYTQDRLNFIGASSTLRTPSVKLVQSPTRFVW